MTAGPPVVPPLRRGDGASTKNSPRLRRGDGRNMLRPYGLACTYPCEGGRMPEARLRISDAESGPASVMTAVR